MISSRHLDEMPDIPAFVRLTRSLALLDAILSPEWDYRYYSFDSHWASGEMMASMRNGSGDHWFALITGDGVALHGLAHEAPIFRPAAPPAGEYDRLPAVFHGTFLQEPAFETEHSTFCIWRLISDRAWSSGPVKLPTGPDPDGSVELLRLFSGDPRHYVEFAAEYYERSLQLDDVAAVYAHQPLTDDLVDRLNHDVSVGRLADDLKQIGYGMH